MENQSNFIKTIMEDDIKTGKHDEIITRFPPEPNGFLHIGHARAIVTNFELAKVFGGKTNLRYDDTNPSKEDEVYVKGIIEDVRWLGYEPAGIYWASDYFEEMYQRAIILIKKGLAYVDDQSAEEIAKTRGDVVTPGIPSPYRNRTVDENLELFAQMREGKFKEGEKVLRAKIDMASPNMNMRDPVLYRINFASHHNTGDTWKVYPMYDFAHPIEDAIEGITHSLCSLEFEDHRPLYDWVVRETEMPHTPRQIEFGRLGIVNTVMSKRLLKYLVDSNYVDGWDDPRMPTLSGLRRKGYTKEAIRAFILATGLAKVNSEVEVDMLESFVRDDLQARAGRAFAVINPLKVTITNYPEGKIEYFDVPFHPENTGLGSRKIAFSKHVYIEQEDFSEVKPDNKYKRLSLGGEVRLFHTYFIKATDVVKDENGKIVEVLATYDEKTLSGSGFNERKPDGTIHFVEATTAIPATFNFFGPLLDADTNKTIDERYNPNSLSQKQGFIEGGLKDVKTDEKFQFVRNGYFNCYANKKTNNPYEFNEIVPLKSSYK
ncbi:glutamine--tRNA ligase/YqeY domain fusion protein [Acholeplasma equirhinis]|uniref:glutamine--tRNA ligase/YqeY domain fusion protein n=1 Tax=Acholeplasma equirhinis TaxID=555393 RepID=UPI00197AEAF5|nr:glutamine--tRNA ligase/YqeY domain fusion protein [Acholeplasma equirhinis]MBN3490984.1 glutamine--tRNA ligase/YqeY domain fusion protein [Acholeplasma equirhinis]